MKIRNLSGILFCSKIVSISILLLPVLVLLITANLCKTESKPNDAARALSDDSIDKIEYAYIDQGVTVVIFDDGTKHHTVEPLTKLCNKVGMHKVTGYVAVKPSKSCWYKMGGKPFIKTLHHVSPISDQYWNNTFRQIFNQCST